jgi:prophage regulatory protein
MDRIYDRLLRRRDVEAIVGLSRSAIYAKIAERSFPEPVKIASHAVRWRESDVRQWMERLKSRAKAA